MATVASMLKPPTMSPNPCSMKWPPVMDPLPAMNQETQEGPLSLGSVCTYSQRQDKQVWRGRAVPSKGRQSSNRAASTPWWHS